MLVALAIQFPLAGLAVLLEWSQRKKRPPARREPLVSRGLEAERPAAPRTEQPTARRAERLEPPAESAAPSREPSAPRPELTAVTPSPIPAKPLAPPVPAEVSVPPLEVRETAVREAELAPAAEVERPKIAEVQPRDEVVQPAETPGQPMTEAPVQAQRRQQIGRAHV